MPSAEAPPSRPFSRAVRRLVAALLSAAVVAIAAAGCTKVGTQSAPGAGPGRSAAGHPWTRHGVLRIASLSEPDSLNPLVGNQQIDVDLSMFWAGYLFNWSDRNEFVPELATTVPTAQNGGISRDGLAITYHLRRGVRWHDGEPFTADDVIFTWHAVMNPRNNVPARVGYDLIDRIDKRDDFTIVVHLRRSYAPFIASFFTMSSTAFPVLPAHLLAKHPDINRVAYNSQPIGTGPFTVERWQRGQNIVFRANPSYWRGHPKLNEVVYSTVPDENTIVTLLRAHEIDLDFSVGTRLYPSVRHIPGMQTRLLDFTQYGLLDLNLKTPALADRRVRQALADAFDRDRVNRVVAYGTGIPEESDQPRFLWAYNAHLRPRPYDPAAARRLLDAAGWRPGRDGIRVNGGRRLSLTLAIVAGSPAGTSTALEVQRMWRAIGVETQIKTYVTSLFFASYGAGGILQTGKYNVAIHAWVNGVDPDDSTLFMCDQFPPNGQNSFHFCDPALDRWERVALDHYDRATRKRAYDEIQAILVDELPQIVIAFARRIVVANTDLKNFKPAHAVTEFWNPWELEI